MSIIPLSSKAALIVFMAVCFIRVELRLHVEQFRVVTFPR
jgi:hypothetical protein